MTRKRKYARYPEYFGKLDCKGLVLVAEKHGMLVITCSKPDMHCHAEVGLYGTPEQMRAVEAEWTEHGNTVPPRKPKTAFGVLLTNVPRAEWLSIEVARSKANAISTRGGTQRVKIKGRTRTLPPGYRELRSRELPTPADIAWNESVEVFEPIDTSSLKRHGKRRFMDAAHLILRKQ